MNQIKRFYCNNKVLSIDGQLLFRCHDKRIKWYLKKNLAYIIEKGPPTTIQLNFKTNGNGCSDDDYGIAYKESICVVCGTKHNLSRHHVVPYYFRTKFPLEFKNHSAHDVVALCVKCHNNYEIYAVKLKDRILHKLVIGKYHPIQKTIYNYEKIFGFIRNIIKHDKNIPSNRKNKIIERIRQTVNIAPPFRKQHLKQLETIIENYKKQRDNFPSRINLEKFVVLWRKHFVRTMQPKYLPHLWKINRSIKRNK